MMGFRSPPFRLFLFPLPFAALLAAEATCLALLMAAFLISLPFIIWRRVWSDYFRRECGGVCFQMVVVVVELCGDDDI